MRLLELQNESDSLQACAAAGRSVADPNLRGWVAILPQDVPALVEGMKSTGLPVLRGSKGAIVLGSVAQLWSSARSLAEGLERERARALAAQLRDAAAGVEETPQWVLPRSKLPVGRTLVMGVINVTPDSFSDGGQFLDAGAAVAHGLKLAAEGADLLDVGGESTRPGAPAVSVADERARVEPVLRELSRQLPRTPLSIDTTKSLVARAAIDAGAEIVNDVSGLSRDPQMGMACKQAAVCLMHMRGTSADMQQRAVYADLHGEVLAELSRALLRAREAEIPAERIALDPGLGFAKNPEHNLTLLRRLRELRQLGRPLLVGASRKSFLGKITGKPAGERVYGSIAAAVIAAGNGALIVRVHDVAATREALAVADAVHTSTA